MPISKNNNIITKQVVACLLFFPAFLLLNACSEPVVAPENKLYFDLENFMSEQSAHLQKSQVTINKQLFVNGEQEELTLKELNWEKEFAFYTEADINKPSWRNSFETDTVINAESGQKSVVHTSTEDDINVKWLKLNYSPQNQLVSIEARVKSENMLYSSSRDLLLDCFYDEADSLRIKGYSLKGYQKLIMQDSVNFSAKAQINY